MSSTTPMYTHDSVSLNAGNLAYGTCAMGSTPMTRAQAVFGRYVALALGVVATAAILLALLS